MYVNLQNIKKPLSTCPTRTVYFCSFDQDADSKLNNDDGRERLCRIGIQSQKHVGQWLIDTLKHQKQNLIADKLSKYFNRGLIDLHSYLHVPYRLLEKKSFI